jgi:recombinational DNA repair protein RecT
MPWADIEKVRMSSPAGAKTEYDVKKSGGKIGDAKGIWEKWPEEMSRKTAFRRCSKWLPQSIEDANRLFANDQSLGDDDNLPHETEAEGASLADAIGEAGVTIDNETGEVLEGSSLTQPDLKAEVEKKKESVKKTTSKAKCETCVDTGIVHTADGKGPCPDCGPKEG